MKLFFRYAFMAAAAMMTVAGLSSCENEGGETGYDEMYAQILDQYVSKTVVPTYKAMADAALVMRTANQALLDGTLTDAKMEAAATAWRAARIPWERSEAFLFGPVGENYMNIDGHIDSWPLELTAITDEIAKIAQGGTFTGKQAWNKDPEVIGFHVTEYLLFRDGKVRKAAQVTEAELRYLTAATDALVWDCILAYVAWVGEENVSAEMKAVFRENADVVSHLETSGAKNFARKLSQCQYPYTSWTQAVGEIADGCAEIAGEVGSVKITEPYYGVNDAGGDHTKVESWYSWNSLTDYEGNIVSIKNAYLNGTPCLSDYVKLADAGLDTDIKAKIEECITKIRAIGTGGYSFYEVVRDQRNKNQVDAAVEACVDLQDLFDRIKSIIE